MTRFTSLVAFGLLVFTCSTAAATNISFTGTFTHDTDLEFFTFTLANPTPGVTLRTWSYAGGVNAVGETIAAGGFEPYLNLYLSDGTQMNPGISGPCGGPLSPDPTTGACGDVYYPTEASFPGGVWAAGTYIAVLSIFANPGIGNLPDGFFADVVLGLPSPSNFTCEVGAPGYQGNPPTAPTDAPFCDEFLAGNQRTGQWALDILNVDSATGPAAIATPASLSLALAGGLMIFGRRLRARRA